MLACACFRCTLCLFAFQGKKESRVRKRGTRAPRISETELRLFGGTPTFLLGLFSRLPRICSRPRAQFTKVVFVDSYELRVLLQMSVADRVNVHMRRLECGSSFLCEHRQKCMDMFRNRSVFSKMKNVYRDCLKALHQFQRGLRILFRIEI